MFDKLKSLLKKSITPDYESISDVYSIEEYIKLNKEMEEFNRWFIDFFEKLLEIKFSKVQYVVINWRLGLLVNEFTWLITEEVISEYLDDEDYSYKNWNLILYFE